MESPNATHNTISLSRHEQDTYDKLIVLWTLNRQAIYFLRFALFVTLLRNFPMKFGGISEQSLNPLLFLLLNFASVEQKRNVHDLVIEKLGKVTKGLHKRWLLLPKKHGKLDYATTCIWFYFS